MRGKRAKKRVLYPDPIYNSLTLSKFMNYFMFSGKKTIAQKQVYEALKLAAEKTKLDPMDAFEKALENIKPKMEVRSRRVGGSNYQIPMPVAPNRQEFLAMRWLISGARDSRKTNNSALQLANEIVSAINKEGFAFKKKEETHRMAEANKAFAHFSW